MLAERHGLLQVYTGDGKGKTTAALGATWRALGADLHVCFVQFLKGGLIPSEQTLAARLAPALVFQNLCHPYSKALMGGHPGEEDRHCAAATWALARAALADPAYDLVVLDEINNTLHLGLVSLEEVLTALAARPAGQEVICTGRHAPAELIAAADLVTEMLAIKHPFDQGLASRRGFDY
jgi:cob(I)alamin adenosyltransferase